jgi:hypothetical protein
LKGIGRARARRRGRGGSASGLTSYSGQAELKLNHDANELEA